jgi:hypothetical protein
MADPNGIRIITGLEQQMNDRCDNLHLQIGQLCVLELQSTNDDGEKSGTVTHHLTPQLTESDTSPKTKQNAALLPPTQFIYPCSAHSSGVSEMIPLRQGTFVPFLFHLRLGGLVCSAPLLAGKKNSVRLALTWLFSFFFTTSSGKKKISILGQEVGSQLHALVLSKDREKFASKGGNRAQPVSRWSRSTLKRRLLISSGS